MNPNFSEQELKERLLDLLYGLVDDENEAEELRRLVATDADAARLFDEARETSALLARAARAEIEADAPIEETSKNVAVDRDAVAAARPFAFDAAVGAFEQNVFNVDADASGSAETTEFADLSEFNGLSVSVADVDSSSRKEKKDKKEKKRAKAALAAEKKARKAREKEAKKSTLAAARARAAVAPGDWATVGRTADAFGRRRTAFSGAARAARRFSRTLGKTSLFQRLSVALALLGLTTLLGFAAQEMKLRETFENDFRIQLAAPPVLARGVSQSIFATTTAPNGNPRRIPLRFCFSDAQTGDLLLAHTESGDASGVARFVVPDLTDFPRRVRLTISAGERDAESIETLETILTVVDGDAAARNGDSSFAASKSRRRFVDFPTTNNGAMMGAPSDAKRGESVGMGMRAAPAPVAAADVADFAAFNAAPVVASAPESVAESDALGVARASGGAERAVGADAAFHSVAPESVAVALDVEDETAEISAVSEDASPIRVAAVRFFPEGGRLVADFENRVWFSCVDAAGEPVAARFALKNRDAENAVETPEIVAESSESGVGSFVLTPRADAEYSLERVQESGENAQNGGETFPIPSAERGRVAFAAPSKIAEPGAPLSLDVETRERVPVAATVEKDGVVVAQRVWVADEGRRRVALPLPENVGGALTVSLYLCEGRPLEKVGATAFYRKTPGETATETAALAENLAAPFDAELRRDGDADALFVKINAPAQAANPRVYLSNTREIDVDAVQFDSTTQIARVEPSRLRNREKTARLEIFWAPNRDAATTAFLLDETLAAADDSTKIERLATLDVGANAAPAPIVFDNLRGMKRRVLEKWNDFWRVEARWPTALVRFGLFGCVSLATLAGFFVVFRALSLGRGAIVVGACCAIAAFFHLEQKSIDFSSELSKAIAFSVAEEEKDAAEPSATLAQKSKISAKSEIASDSNANGAAPKRVAVREIPVGEPVAIRLDEILPPEEARTGVLLVKVGDGSENWTILELNEPTPNATDGENS